VSETGWVAVVFLVCFTLMLLATVFYDEIAARRRGGGPDGVDGLGEWDRDDEEVGS
jgi:hypothetical protein